MFNKIAGNKGFTLIEIIVVVAILSITVLIGAISVKEYMPRYRLKGAAREVLGTFQKARLEAVKRNAVVCLEFTNGTASSGKVEVFVDNGDGGGTAGNMVQDGGEVLLATVSMPKDIQIAGASFDGTAITGFNSRGVPAAPSGPNLRTGSVQIKNSDKTYTLTLEAAGRVKLD